MYGKKRENKKILIGVVILVSIIFTGFLVVATTRITDTFIETAKIKVSEIESDSPIKYTDNYDGVAKFIISNPSNGTNASVGIEMTNNIEDYISIRKFGSNNSFGGAGVIWNHGQKLIFINDDVVNGIYEWWKFTAPNYETLMKLNAGGELNVSGDIYSKNKLVCLEDGSNCLSTFLNLSGTNANQNMDISNYNFTANSGLFDFLSVQNIGVSKSIKLDTSTKGICDSSSEGTIVYEIVSDEGHLYLCKRKDAATFEWKKLD